MASKSTKENGCVDAGANDNAGFLIRLRALEVLNRTLPADLRVSINKNEIDNSLAIKKPRHKKVITVK
jgi:hypothetical protein